MSAVNLAEVLSKLVEVGVSPDEAMNDFSRLGILGRLTIVQLSSPDSVAIGRLHGRTRSHGLSLGDRACLALGQRLRVPVLTADRAWSRLSLDVRVTVIR